MGEERESRQQARRRMTEGVVGEDRGTARGRAARKQESAAASFRFNPEMERARELKENHPGEFDRLPAGVKMQLGYYLKAKDAAIAEGRDVTGG